MILQKLKIIFLAILTLPLFIVVYLLDRLLLSFLVWRSTDKLDVWMNNHEQVVYSFVRVLLIVSGVSLYNIWL